jgi:hypothetical protein
MAARLQSRRQVRGSPADGVAESRRKFLSRRFVWGSPNIRTNSWIRRIQIPAALIGYLPYLLCNSVSADAWLLFFEPLTS